GVARPGGEPEGRQAGGDGAAGHDHHPVAELAQLVHLGAELRDNRLVDLAALAGDRRGPDLGDDDHRSSPSSSWNSNTSPPMRTLSPGRAPARASALSMPRRRMRR